MHANWRRRWSRRLLGDEEKKRRRLQEQGKAKEGLQTSRGLAARLLISLARRAILYSYMYVAVQMHAAVCPCVISGAACIVRNSLSLHLTPLSAGTPLACGMQAGVRSAVSECSDNPHARSQTALWLLAGEQSLQLVSSFSFVSVSPPRPSKAASSSRPSTFSRKHTLQR